MLKLQSVKDCVKKPLVVVTDSTIVCGRVLL